LDKEVARALSGQFARREVKKTYRALVRGFLEPDGTVERPLEREPGAVPKAARTDWVRLSTGVLPYAIGRYPTARYSMLSLKPTTGRRHQLRRHCAHLRHPVIGDVRYGDRHHNHFFRDKLGCNRLFLHAERLELMHPREGITLSLEASLPPEFGIIQERFAQTLRDEQEADVNGTLVVRPTGELA
jgi:tRNA pseudouridine65 synthase